LYFAAEIVKDVVLHLKVKGNFKKYFIMNANFSFIGLRKYCVMIGLTLISLISQSQQLTRIQPNTQTLVVDLTEISSIISRSAVYDFLKSNKAIEILSFENASRVILSSNMLTQSELQQYYQDAVQRIVSKNASLSKKAQTAILTDFASKYGFETANHLMRSVTETENDSCHRSLPFCTDLVYNFPAGVNSGNGQSGPNYGCLGSEPNPAWYHMKIAIAGSLTIKMFSTPSRDIDFIMWGPFADPVTPCTAELTANKIIDCSYSTAPIEFCDIPNALWGKYYILLITNYSNQPCNITFQKTGGTGVTDCTIVPPPIGSNSPVCYGENIQLTADDFAGATYAWTGPNGWSSNQQNPVITNADLNDAGLYSLVITVGGSSSDAVSTEVVVNALPIPQFAVESVCLGDTTHFTNQSTTNPPDQTITSRLWNFGDMQTSTLENPTHIYTSSGDFTVTLTCYTGFSNCTESISYITHVYDYPTANAGIDQSLPNGWNTILSGSMGGGTGSLQFEWTHPELLVNPAVLNPTTLNLSQSVVFTLTVTDQISGCSESDDMSINVTGGALSVQATATPNILCKGESSQLFANTNGGAPDPTYTWTSVPAGFSSNIQNPVVSPTVNTTYNVSVFDGQVTVTASTSITVKPFPVAFAGNDQTINVGTSTNLNGSTSSGSGSFEYFWSPADSLAIPATGQHEAQPLTRLLNAPTTFALTIHDNNGCVSIPDYVTIYTAGQYLAVYTSTEDNELCIGDSTTIKATATGGDTTAYSFSWTAANSSWTSTESEPTVNPTTTTVYTVVAQDGFKEVDASIEILVHLLPVVDVKPANINWYANDTINVCVRDSIWLDAGDNTRSYLWNNGSTDHKIRALTNGLWVDFQTYSVTVTNNVTGCQSADTITLFFDFTVCGLGIDDKSDITDNMKLRPNPTKGLFTVELVNINEDGTIAIANSNGMRIDEKFISMKGSKPSTETFDLTPYPNGVYLIWFSSENYRAVKQIIKN